MRSSVILLLSLFLSSEAMSQSLDRDYYITLSNDTVFAQINMLESRYLVYPNQKGKKRKYTPSQVKQFHLNSLDYIPMYLHDFDSKYFLSVRVKGAISVYKYDGIDQHNSGMPSGGAVAGGFEGSFRNRVSGYYLTMPGDNLLLTVPAKQKLFTQFIREHFPDDLSLIAKADNSEVTFKDIENIAREANRQLTR